MELLKRRLGCFRLEADSDDRRYGSKIFQVRLQHPEKRFDVVGRLGDLKPVRVTVLVAESDFELELARHQMESAKSNGKLLEKPSQYKEKRFAGFNFVFEFERFFKRFAKRDELEQARCFSGSPFPKFDPNRPEPGGNCFLFESGELA